MITIVDYGSGNLRSVEKAFNRIHVPAKVSSSPDDIMSATKLLLPGVGHFKKGMDNLHKSGLIEPLNEAVLKNKTPILGICLGMQLMTSFSEEGDCDGLNWVPAVTKQFKGQIPAGMKIPHMGWNSIKDNFNSPLLSADRNVEDLFYFVHSYYVESTSEELETITTQYGREIVSGFRKDNVFGVQFHPEKSHEPGLRLLEFFSAI